LPASFSKLRITGFKSFAEPTGVDIHPGLTGIVGPNGCGKSNIVEALRWAMGESSARGLRGGEMEDVIFSGTVGRPSRNIAEVVVTLSDTRGAAPPPFHDLLELEIQRRIERGVGSTYRINGREARARDVQTLFADLASGARASAMVSQGRVSALVVARPEERRSVLEEAAGITGLHARRHEAELKLRAAEANLARAEDSRAQLETQLTALKRQVRQASRYRNISGAVRAAEVDLFAILHARATRNRESAELARREAENAVTAANTNASSARAAVPRASEAVLPLREAESTTRTNLERYRVALEHLEAEEHRARTGLEEARRRLSQIEDDLKHAEQIRSDAEIAEVRLKDEDVRLGDLVASHQQRLDLVEAEAAEACDAARLAEQDANHTIAAAAEADAQARSSSQTVAHAEQTIRRLTTQIARARDERVNLVTSRIDPAELERAAAGLAAEQDTLTAAATSLGCAEQARTVATSMLAAALEAHTATAGHCARLAAESRALTEILAVKDGERWLPAIDAVVAPGGLEDALGAVLGEELTSSLDAGADRHWRELPPLEAMVAMPSGVTPLSRVVQAPPALSRSLSRIGLIENEEVGLEFHAEMAPGQTLVSRNGAVWRWDGYTVRAGTPTPATIRLRQRNRLTSVREALAVAELEASTTKARHTEAAAAARDAICEEKSCRDRRQEIEQCLERSRAAFVALRERATSVASRLTAVEESLSRLEAEHGDANELLEKARAIRAASADVADLRIAVEQSGNRLAQARARESAALATVQTLKRERDISIERRRAIELELRSWLDRANAAASRIVSLTDRLRTATIEMTTLEAAPEQAAARREEAVVALRLAEQTHQRASEDLGEATASASMTEQLARSAEIALSSCREAAVRAEAAVDNATQMVTGVTERILERLGSMDGLPVAPEDLTPEIENKARVRLERLVKERDEMGPVNLRADAEAEAIAEQIAVIDRDRDDLSTAIARLRGSIGNLNREGRGRLLEVFQAVDRNFQHLFTRMFGGGRAHLALVGSDDPLLAGLEIYAQPPGKKLTALSLLSGGEQALTALSLIFAVFRCNPAPICVLDEVDAPLDDANVERLCTLLEDIERETGTRFLVVTHHPMTMARMDRLYGVTMQERGVSRLISVDLARAAAMVEQRNLPLEDARVAAD
jgi:chromosome segregation protein